MSNVICMEWLLDKWKGQVQNRGCQWIGFDKYNKLVYGVVACGKKLQLVTQSVFGGDAIVVQEIDAGLRYNTRLTGVVTDVFVAVVVDGFFCFYLFSLFNKPVEKYEIVQPKKSFGSGVFGRGVLIDRGLFYSPHIGFFTMVYCEGSGQFMYRFIFDNAKKTCVPELVTKYPDLVSYSKPMRRYSGNDNYFCVFKEGGDMLHVYDFQRKSWSKKILRNAPLLTVGGTMKYGRSLKGVTTSKEGKTVAVFFNRQYMLRELVGDSWESCPVGDFENLPVCSFCSRTLCTGGGVYVDGGSRSVMIIQQSISLRDIAVKKVIGCWNSNKPDSFQSFLIALNLPALAMRDYFGLTTE